ncbi:MAG: Slp family lipoprotein, partial [Nitrospira sp.]|nr:Slp family lipoprotein [Nitrospira sp.]
MRLLMLRAGILFMMLWRMVGCASLSSSPFAEKWESQVTPHVLFSQVLQDPQAFMGTTLKVGGEVISAKRYPDRTEVMVLQLPLEADSVPGMVRAQSLGRLIAVQKTFLDPATLPPGTRLTLIGTVTGNQTVQVDEQSKTYP